MAGTGLKIDERRKRILEVLAQDGMVRVTQLSELLGATVVTIRSDLDALERDGYLERTQGGAVQSAKNFYNMDFLRRKQERVAFKRAIAAAAASMVRDGETLFINSGTTTYFTAAELKARKNLNIVTNSISAAVELGAQPTFRVILLGGDINTQYSYIYGSDAVEQLGRYKADKAILSMDGISENGITTYHAEEAVVNRLMMERARETLVVADSSKLDFESFSHVSDLGGVSHWITDRMADEAACERLIQLGVSIVYA